jgi:hypothetical protein
MLKRIKSGVLASSPKALVISLMVGALLVATAGFVAAQSSPQIITGCYHNTTKVLRVLTSGSCDPKNETTISWNQVGPQGPQGAKGDPGPQGLQGLQGLQSLQVPKDHKA